MCLFVVWGQGSPELKPGGRRQRTQGLTDAQWRQIVLKEKRQRSKDKYYGVADDEQDAVLLEAMEGRAEVLRVALLECALADVDAKGGTLKYDFITAARETINLPPDHKFTGMSGPNIEHARDVLLADKERMQEYEEQLAKVKDGDMNMAAGGFGEEETVMEYFARLFLGTIAIYEREQKVADNINNEYAVLGCIVRWMNMYKKRGLGTFQVCILIRLCAQTPFVNDLLVCRSHTKPIIPRRRRSQTR